MRIFDEKNFIIFCAYLKCVDVVIAGLMGVKHQLNLLKFTSECAAEQTIYSFALSVLSLLPLLILLKVSS